MQRGPVINYKLRRNNMKKILIVVAVVMTLAIPLGSAYAVEAFRINTEMTWYDKAQTCDGYILHWPMKEKSSKGYNYKDPIGTLYLIDMQGRVVHTWPGIENNPKLYPDGFVRNNDQDPVDPKWIKMAWDGTKTILFRTFDTDGKTTVSSGDNKMIWNKKLNQYTYLGQTSMPLTKAEIVAAGGDPSLPYTGMDSCSVFEWDSTGKVIWKWRFIDHSVQSKNPAWANYVSDVATAPGKRNLFWITNNDSQRGITTGISADWDHVNSIDFNEDLGQVAINAKHWSEFYVVDHDNTFVAGDPAASIKLAASSNGDIIYRFGNPCAYNQGTCPGFMTEGNQQQYGEHNIHWIPEYAWPRPHAEAGDKWNDPISWQ